MYRSVSWVKYGSDWSSIIAPSSLIWLPVFIIATHTFYKTSQTTQTTNKLLTAHVKVCELSQMWQNPDQCYKSTIADTVSCTLAHHINTSPLSQNKTSQSVFHHANPSVSVESNAGVIDSMWLLHHLQSRYLYSHKQVIKRQTTRMTSNQPITHYPKSTLWV